MRDFNTAKFADEDHGVINHIINDVFSLPLKPTQNPMISSSEAVPVEDAKPQEAQLKNEHIYNSDYGNLKELIA